MDTTQGQSGAGQDRLSLLVRQIRFEATGINSYELVDPTGRQLPAFTAGAHIDVHLPDGLIRQYSLCNAPSERHRYVIAVLRDENGRGGSKALHAGLRVQDMASVSHPRNNFGLVAHARKVILLAGGIGVTPLKAMAHALEEAGVPFAMHYCARNDGCIAFRDMLQAPWQHGTAQFHLDQGNPAEGLDIAALLRDQEDGTHLFYCGPSGFMRACADASAHWEPRTVHCEHFKAPDASAARADGADKPRAAGSFLLKIASTGAMVEVAPAQSIVDALEAAGIRVATSCQSGLCGTCKIRYLEGEADHQDFILDDDEHAHWLTACVSRASSPTLLLDL